MILIFRVITPASALATQKETAVPHLRSILTQNLLDNHLLSRGFEKFRVRKIP